MERLAPNALASGTEADCCLMKRDSCWNWQEVFPNWTTFYDWCEGNIKLLSNLFHAGTAWHVREISTWHIYARVCTRPSSEACGGFWLIETHESYRRFCKSYKVVGKRERSKIIITVKKGFELTSFGWRRNKPLSVSDTRSSSLIRSVLPCPPWNLKPWYFAGKPWSRADVGGATPTPI